MTWVKDALAALRLGKPAVVRPLGGSMRGRIESGAEVTISPCDPKDVSVDDVVFIRWKGGFLLHLVKEVRDDSLLIGNNLGKINGWASCDDVLGVVIKVAD